MTKDVIITVSGIQFDVNDGEAVEVVSRGEYFFRNGKHFLVYDEIMEEEQQLTKCILKISENTVELTKQGSSNVHLQFEKNRNNVTYYNTPYGELMLGVTTHALEIREQEQSLVLKLNYSLDMNCQHLSECELTVKAEAV